MLDKFKKSDTTSPKKQHRDKTDLGPDFVAPDGGWGWCVCIAAGFSMLSVYPLIQQFGLIYRERLMELNITNSQITTLINANNAVSSVTGLMNGPLFRRFTFRQVGIAAALLCVVGIFAATLSDSFLAYLLSISVLYGAGFGLLSSSSSLAMCTYFKEKRRSAAGFAWTITSLGPIIMPYVVTILLEEYGVQGTVLTFSAFSMHAVAGALIYQPVQWHTTKPPEMDHVSIKVENGDKLCPYCRFRKATSVFTDNDEDIGGYAVVDPGTPMMARANDGLYGSRLSLASCKWTSTTTLERNKYSNTSLSKMQAVEKCEGQTWLTVPNSLIAEKEMPKLGNGLNNDNVIYEFCTCDLGRKLPTENAKVDNKPEYMPFWRQIVLFFDFDLLRDLTFVNIMIGLTLANFTEMNFSILTPFILSDFNFDKPQIALYMALVASMDTVTRFLIPFVAEKLGWDNQTFFLLGILGMAGGRIVIAHVHSMPVVLAVAVLIGVGKALRTVFLTLVIPGYVPLNRLPAASGLYLLVSGIFTLVAGPLLGVVRDKTNYVVTLHCLNIFTYTTAVFWTVGAVLNKRTAKKHEVKKSVDE